MTNLYEELPTPRSIRVLRLAKHPAAPSHGVPATSEQDPSKPSLDSALHPVRCEISVISLADGETEPFDALSYVWGHPTVREGRMICNGHSLNITINLWSALQQVWKNWPDRVLWVDAICINQEDIPERNQQVAMMGRIYSTASHVVVWLGEPTQGNYSLFEIFNRLERAQSIGNHSPARFKTTGEHDAEPSQDRGRPEHAGGELELTAGGTGSIGPLLEELFSKPWFSRVWTLQEIKLAQRAILCGGPLYADFSSLPCAIDRHNASEPMAHVCGLGYIANPIIEIEQNVTLYNLLVKTKDRRATDPRDKIYGLLSLLPQDLYEFLEPDYSLSEDETIIWASRIFIFIDRDTACLSDAGLDNLSDDSLLPSWAVDWRGRDEYEHEGRRGFPDSLRSDAHLLRERNEYSRSLDRVNKKLHLRGWGFGRLQVAQTSPKGTPTTVFLASFPDCALKSVGAADILRDARECYGLSPESLAQFCKKIKQHDAEDCTCMDDASSVVYPARNLPRKIRDGDWLWRHAFDSGDRVDYIWDDRDESAGGGRRGTEEVGGKTVKTISGLRAKQMNEGHDFVLHPVQDNNDTCLEVNFQVVGEAWGYGIRGLTSATRFSLSLRHPESTVVISGFALI